MVTTTVAERRVKLSSDRTRGCPRRASLDAPRDNDVIVGAEIDARSPNIPAELPFVFDAIGHAYAIGRAVSGHLSAIVSEAMQSVALIVGGAALSEGFRVQINGRTSRASRAS